MNERKLQRKIERATLKAAIWTARLDVLLERQACMDVSVSDHTGTVRLATGGANTGDFLAPDQQQLFRHGQRYHGLIKKTALALGLSDVYVWRVSRGFNRNDSVMAHLRAAMAAIDAVPLDDGTCELSSEQLSQFKDGGRYWGVLSRIARALSVKPNNVGMVARGKSRSKRIAAALRAELARIDAELAAKEANANG